MTANNEITISVSAEAEKLGVKVVAAIFENPTISNRSSALETRKKEVIKSIDLDQTNPILEAYRELYKLCGADFIPAAESLILLVNSNGRLPNINTIVDSYNLASVETSLSIGAHDMDKIKGNLVIGITKGDELYTPLGSNKSEKINIGEIVCMDKEKIVCRFDVKQCEQTKITKNTKSFIIYIQGNKNTSADYLVSALEKVCRYMSDFCSARLVKKLT